MLLEGACQWSAPQKLDTLLGVKMEKYTYEERLKAVLAVVEQQQSPYTVAREMGMSKTTIRRWAAIYEQCGAEGLRSSNNVPYSKEFKESVIQNMYENGLTAFEAATQYGIKSGSVVRRWEYIYNEYGASKLLTRDEVRRKIMSSKQIRNKQLETYTKEELIEKLEWLQLENDYLKKVRALVQEREARESGKQPKPSKD